MKIADEIKYPERYALQEAFEEFLSRQRLNQIAQGEGIFIIGQNQAQLADFMSGLFYEKSQLERIRGIALESDNRNSLSSFRITSENPDFNFVEWIDGFRGEIVNKQEKLLIGAFSLQSSENGSELYKGSGQYSKYQRGRVAFLQGSEQVFDYYIEQINAETWEISIDCSHSNDAVLMHDWLDTKLPKLSKIDKINQEELSTHQTIKFFDEIGTAGGGDGWRFEQVKRIALKRDNHKHGEDEDEKVETDISLLSGISAAILEGNELRNNKFVVDCENGGYRFTAMTFEYHHIREGYVKQIRAEFKTRPKVFEVSLVSYAKRVGVEQKLQDERLSSDRRVALLSLFWTKAKIVYDRLINERPPI